MTASIMNHLEIEMTHDNDLIRRGAILELCQTLEDEAPSGSYDNGGTTDGWMMACRRVEKAIAAIPAVAARQPADPVINADSRQRVMVKPLVWEGHSDDQRSGDYVITPSYGQGPKRLLLARGSKLVSWHDDMDEAQRAGQDDHEARILAALEPQPDPRDTALEIWKLANSRDADDPVFIAAIAAMIGEKK